MCLPATCTVNHCTDHYCNPDSLLETNLCVQLCVACGFHKLSVVQQPDKARQAKLWENHRWQNRGGRGTSSTHPHTHFLCVSSSVENAYGKTHPAFVNSAGILNLITEFLLYGSITISLCIRQSSTLCSS